MLSSAKSSFFWTFNVLDFCSWYADFSNAIRGALLLTYIIGNPSFLAASVAFLILEIAAPILIIMGYYVKISSTLLALFCIATAIIFSSNFTDQMQIISFLKNIALAGGCLILAVNGPKKYSLENKLK